MFLLTVYGAVQAVCVAVDVFDRILYVGVYIVVCL